MEFRRVLFRSVELGLPLFLGILGGTPDHWARYGRAYREAWSQRGHPAGEADIAVAVHGFVGEDNREAKATYLRQETQMFEFLSVETGRSMMPGAGRGRDMERGGMVFAGSPNEVAASSEERREGKEVVRPCRIRWFR